MSSAISNNYGRLRATGNAQRSPVKAIHKVLRIVADSHDYRAVGDHTPYGLLARHLPPDTRYLTVLRDPVDRVLSHYYLHVNAARKGTIEKVRETWERLSSLERQERGAAAAERTFDENGDYSLEEGLAAGIPIYDNLQTRFLWGGESLFEELPPDALERAKENLERFWFVGVTERLNDSIVLLGRKLGVGLMPYYLRHVSQKRPQLKETSAELRDLISERNALDVELYRFARERFDELAPPGSLEDEVADLKRRSAEVTEAAEAARPAKKQAKAAKAAQQRARIAKPTKHDRRLPVVYLHIPKTAGSTIRTVFVRAFSRPAVHNSGNAFRSPERVASKLRGSAAEEGLRAIVGHVSYGLCKANLPPDWRYVTFLREPVDHLLSHYYYMVTPGREGKQLLPTREGPKYLPLPKPETTLEEMLDRGLYLLDNLATRMLYDGESPFGELPPDALQQAKENLRRFTFVGVTERLDESIVLLERALGLELVPYESHKVNVDRPPVEEVPDDQRRLIEEYNKLDLELYAFARDLFEKRLSAADDVSEDVERLKSLSVGRDRPEAQLLGPHRQERKAGRARGPKSRRTQREAVARAKPAGELAVYVHVPKTAGSTLGSIFKTAFPDTTVNGGNVFRDPETARLRIARIGARLDENVAVVTGVLPYGPLADALPDETRYVTLLRDPVDRTLSHYHFFIGSPRGRTEDYFPTREGARKLPIPTKEMPLEEMLERGLYVLDNIATRLLYGGDSPYGDLPDDAAERAKRNLERFAFVGVTERLDESIVLLERVLGTGFVPYTSYKVNRDRPRVEDVPEGERQLIERYNTFDRELYAFAHELFSRRLAEAGDVSAEVEKLRSVSVGRERPEAQLDGPVRSRKRVAPEPKPPIVYMRIPNTGAVVDALLRETSGAGVRDAGDAFRDDGRALMRARRLAAREGIVAGTAPYPVLKDALPDGARFITFLRDPVERAVAAAREDEPVVTNVATRMLSGSESLSSELPPDALERAKENLEQFEFVGLVERLDESAALLGRKFGRDSVLQAPREERARKQRVSDEQRARILERNALDAELYAFATELFERQAAAAA